MPSREMHTVMEFCLEHAESASVARRVLLYRGLAEFCGSPEKAAEFRQLAFDLEAADQRCREFAFKLTKGTGAGNGGQA